MKMHQNKVCESLGMAMLCLKIGGQDLCHLVRKASLARVHLAGPRVSRKGRLGPHWELGISLGEKRKTISNRLWKGGSVP